MARGRMISSDITKDKRINELSDDTSRLAFTWLVTFADADGRIYGDPALVRSLLFPRRNDVSIEQMSAYIAEWHTAGLICWYKANGDQWIHFSAFDRHQIGLRRDRESPSVIPPPPAIVSVPIPNQLRSNSGVTPEEIGLIKEKLSEVEVNADDFQPGPVALLSEMFVNTTHIPELTGGAPKWVEALKKMADVGVTPNDLKTAIGELREKKYQIVGPWSCINGAIIVMSGRMNKNNGRPALDGYTQAGVDG